MLYMSTDPVVYYGFVGINGITPAYDTSPIVSVNTIRDNGHLLIEMN